MLGVPQFLSELFQPLLVTPKSEPRCCPLVTSPGSRGSAKRQRLDKVGTVGAGGTDSGGLGPPFLFPLGSPTPLLLPSSSTPSSRKHQLTSLAEVERKQSLWVSDSVEFVVARRPTFLLCPFPARKSSRCQLLNRPFPWGII